MAPHGLKPYQLLEINIISAQDLEPLSKNMRTYAMAWVHEHRKLLSSVDTDGNINPTWNDKFVFRVDDEFLREDNSAIMIEIYAMHWFKDKLVGTVRALIGNLISPPDHSDNDRPLGMRCVALQVRRPSGRPQGILNIGVALLDGSLRSMPLYTQPCTSAVGYRHLMDDPPTLQLLQKTEDKNIINNNNQTTNVVKPILRRSKSERSERVTFEKCPSPKSSIVGVPGARGRDDSSILSITDTMDPFKVITKKGKASSVINGAELIEKPRKNKGKKSKASSVVSGSVYSKESSIFHKFEMPHLIKPKKDEQKKKDEQNKILNEKVVVDEKPLTKPTGITKNASPPNDKKPPLPLPLPPIGIPVQKYNDGYDYGTAQKGSKYGIGAPRKGNSVWSDSEVGPSPSEVAAYIAEKRYPLEQDNESSVLSGWSLDESVEGLRSKLDRWRTELPPIYDRGSYTTASSTYKSSAKHGRSKGNNMNEAGLFSCFGNIFGIECQCVCGKPPAKRSRSTRFYSPSTLTPGRSYL